MVQVQKLSFIYSSSPSTFQVDRESTVSADVCFAKYYSCLLSYGKFRVRRWRMDPGNEDSRRKGTDPFNDNLNHCNTVSESIELRFLIFNFRKRFITILIFGMTWIPTKFLGGGDWVWHTRGQVTNLLEHTFLQDLPWNEDRPPDQVHCHQQERQLSVLTDRGRELPRYLTGP